MLKKNLLLTTAFVVVGTLSFLAARSAAVAAPVKIGAARDRNSEFLHTYSASGSHASCPHGQIDVLAYLDDCCSETYSAWFHVAVPITGTGKTVDRILVEDGVNSSWGSNTTFSVGIHASNRDGFPGKLIVGNTATALPNCGKITVPITPTRLKRKTRYWIEEAIPAPHRVSSGTEVYWQLAPNSRRKAYLQSHYWQEFSSVSQSTTSPWQLQSGAPFFRLG